jgi:ferric iron reductase protein FhuF
VKTVDASPVVEIYDALRTLDASWAVEIVTPTGEGWVAGEDLRDSSAGPFNELLQRIGERAKTKDRRTVAASFALRYGWASAMAIAPFLRYRCVPDVSLANVSFKFRESTFFECTAMYEPRGIVVEGDPRGTHPSMMTVSSEQELLRALRTTLVSQSTPVVDALYRWSGFARKGTWGMLTSSWASQFTGLCEDRNDHRSMAPLLEGLFEGKDVVARMQPTMHAVTCDGATHLYQRRASCCRYYLIAGGELCASCPLVSDEDRAVRNLEWMKTQLERQAQRRGHS